MKFLLFMITFVAALSIVSCNDAEIKAKHPIAVGLVETAAKDLGDVLESIVDTELHLPSGSTSIVVTDLEHEIEK